MKNRKFYNLDCLNFSLKEKRLICAGEEETPGFLDALGYVGKGFGQLSSAAARLFDFVVGVAADGVEFIQESYGYVKGKAKVAIAELDKPGKPKKLKEYREIQEHFKLPNTGDADVDNIAKRHMMLAFLTFKAALLSKFHEPALTHYREVGGKLDEIEANRLAYRSEQKTLKKFIKENTPALKHLYKGDPTRIELQTRIRDAKAKLKVIEARTSYIVPWPTPEEIETEFPPGSNVYVKKFFPNNEKKTNVNLKILYGYLTIYTEKLRPSFWSKIAGKKTKLEIYREEMGKLAYARDYLKTDIVASAPAEILAKGQKLLKWNIEKKRIDTRLKALKKGMKFKTRGTAQPIIFAIYKSSPKSAPPIEKKPDEILDNKDDLLNSLP